MFTLDNNLEDMRNTAGEDDSQSDGKPRIMVIDENRDFVTFFKMILNHLGYDAFGAYNGENGITMAKYLQPNLIFCDMELPDMSGCKAAEAIKSDHPAFIIALSKQFEEADMEEGCFDLFMTKPIRTSLLDSVFQNVFKPPRAS